MPTRESAVLARRRPTEAQFQGAIIDLAKVLGYFVYHTRLSFGSQQGFPDLACVRPGDDARPGRLVFIEVKGPRGRVSDAQQEWIAALASVPGVTAIFAWPDDWDTVERALGEEQR